MRYSNILSLERSMLWMYTLYARKSKTHEENLDLCHTC